MTTCQDNGLKKKGGYATLKGKPEHFYKQQLQLTLKGTNIVLYYRPQVAILDI